MIFLIRNLGITICCIFYYTKLLHLTTPKYFLLQSSIFSILLSSFSIYTELYYPYCTTPTILLSVFLFLKYNTKISVTVSLTATTLAFVLSHITLLISSIITGTFLANLYDNKLLIIIQILSCCLQLVIMPLPFRIRRLKKGMPFLLNKMDSSEGMVISMFALLIISATIYLQKMNTDNADSYNLKMPLLFFFMLLCSIGFILYRYWQTNITKTYQDKLRKREIEELQEKNAILEAEIMRLGKIVHKDNSMIREYAFILRTYLTNNTVIEKDTLYNGEKLLEKLERLTEERNGIIYQQDIHCKKFPSTKVSSIDSLLAFKQQTAVKEDINLEVCFSCDIAYLVEEIVHEDDLHTILTYLLDNAVIANKHNNSHHIMLNINITENTYHISVLDSGIPFTTDVIAKWGSEQITTHKNDGGSGIGLMTIYEILQKYNASFIINEIPSGNLIYTKSVTIAFDKMNNYILQTARPNAELSQLSQRTDLQIVKQ